jgi:tetratricopeptide (TPR) repeat protein
MSGTRAKDEIGNAFADLGGHYIELAATFPEDGSLRAGITEAANTAFRRGAELKNVQAEAYLALQEIRSLEVQGQGEKAAALKKENAERFAVAVIAPGPKITLNLADYACLAYEGDPENMLSQLAMGIAFAETDPDMALQHLDMMEPQCTVGYCMGVIEACRIKRRRGDEEGAAVRMVNAMNQVNAHLANMYPDLKGYYFNSDFDERQREEITAKFEAAIATDPENAYLYAIKGIYEVRCAEYFSLEISWDEVMADLQRAVELKPTRLTQHCLHVGQDRRSRREVLPAGETPENPGPAAG